MNKVRHGGRPVSPLGFCFLLWVLIAKPGIELMEDPPSLLSHPPPHYPLPDDPWARLPFPSFRSIFLCSLPPFLINGFNLSLVSRVTQAARPSESLFLLAVMRRECRLHAASKLIRAEEFLLGKGWQRWQFPRGGM